MADWINVSSTDPQIAYVATASQTAFSVPFVFFEDEDLNVYQNGALLVLADDYTVTGEEDEDGGTVTLLTGATLGDEIAIVRDILIEQTTHIPPSGPLDIGSINIQFSKIIGILQQLWSSAIHFPDSDANLPTEIAPISTRANKLLGFDSDGEMTYVTGPTFVDETGTGVANMISRATAVVTTFDVDIDVIRTASYDTAGDGGGALYKRAASQPSHPGKFQSADGAWWEIVPEHGILMAESFGAKADATTNNSTAFQNWWDTCKYLNAEGVGKGGGTYCLESAVTWTGTIANDPGPRIRFAGSYRTYVDTKLPAGEAAMVIYGGTLFSQGGYLKGFTFKSTALSPVPALQLRALYRFTVEDVVFQNLTGHGCALKNQTGDADALNQLTFERCFWINCDIGLVHDFAPTVVQASFVICNNCFFQANRTVGWYYIGLSGGMYNTHFTENGSGGGGLGGFYAADNSAANASFKAVDCSWENNYVASVRVNAMQGGGFENCEIAGGTAGIVATSGFVLTGCSDMLITGTRARVGSALNPFTMFNLGTNSIGNIIENTHWRTFDGTGQVRYLLDATAVANKIEGGTQIGDPVSISLAVAAGANANVALPLEGETFQLTGAAGNYTVSGFANGWDGREITVWNNTAFTCGFQHETTSTAGNRLQCPDEVTSTITKRSTARFTYFAGVADRWVMTGKAG